jgi:ribosomal-protein-alanine N-acetyltransferase
LQSVDGCTCDTRDPAIETSFWPSAGPASGSTGIAAPRTAVEFDAYLARSRREDHESLLVFRREDDALVGVIDLSRIARGNFQSAYLGYRIGAPYARQGTMTEALALAVRHAFRTLRLHRLEANIQPENEASIRLVRRLGFVREGFSRRYLKIGGRWRDHERWALLRQDWSD